MHLVELSGLASAARAWPARGRAKGHRTPGGALGRLAKGVPARSWPRARNERRGHRAPDCARRGGRGARDGGPGRWTRRRVARVRAGHASRARRDPRNRRGGASHALDPACRTRSAGPGARRGGCAARVCRDRRRERVARVGVGASHALGGGQKWRDASWPGRSIPKPRRFFRKPSGDRATRTFGGMKKRPEDSGRFDMRLCELVVTRTRSCRRAWG